MQNGAVVIMETSLLRIVLKRTKYNQLIAVHEKKSKDAMGEVTWIEVDSKTTNDDGDKIYIFAMEFLYDKWQSAERQVTRLEQNNLEKSDLIEAGIITKYNKDNPF